MSSGGIGDTAGIGRVRAGRAGEAAALLSEVSSKTISDSTSRTVDGLRTIMDWTKKCVAQGAAGIYIDGVSWIADWEGRASGM